MRVATDGMSILFQCAIKTIYFTKSILKLFMGVAYSSSSHCTVAYDDVAQEMQEKKLHPQNNLYWGAPQVVYLKWECAGAAESFKHDYKIDYVNVVNKERRNHQCHSVVIVSW